MPVPRRTSTHATSLLLDRLRDPAEQEAWEQIDARYRPVISGFVRFLGLSESDAADVAQSTLVALFESLRSGAYRREMGRLRPWAMGIARRQASMLRRADARRRVERGESAFDADADDATLSVLWEEQERRCILQNAWELLRGTPRISPSNLRAFEMIVLGGSTPEQAAVACGLRVDHVHVIKGRLARKLQELVADLTRAYTDDH